MRFEREFLPSPCRDLNDVANGEGDVEGAKKTTREARGKRKRAKKGERGRTKRYLPWQGTARRDWPVGAVDATGLEGGRKKVGKVSGITYPGLLERPYVAGGAGYLSYMTDHPKKKTTKRKTDE